MTRPYEDRGPLTIVELRATLARWIGPPDRDLGVANHHPRCKRGNCNRCDLLHALAALLEFESDELLAAKLEAYAIRRAASGEVER